jgi:uncharacterized ferritin-like protein (DUF455 family)
MMTTPAEPAAFVAGLLTSIEGALTRIGEAQSQGEPGPAVTVVSLLKLALRNELEAAEEAAVWLVSEPDVEVKLSLMRQCGDEARHYRLIEARLRAMGVDLQEFDPMAGGYSPMFSFLGGLTTTVERIAAGPFAREALARVRNDVFIDYCEAQGDPVTAALYRDVIQPDEAHHHQLGRRLLERLAVSAEQQALASAAAARTLELAEELGEIARLKKGICRAPGC